MRDNRSTQYPANMVFFDTEAQRRIGEHHEDQQACILVGWYVRLNGDGSIRNQLWKTFTRPEKFWQWICSLIHEKETLWIIAHNVYYDLQASGFFYYMRTHDWEREFVYDKGMTSIYSIRNGRRHLKAISTTNYFQASLAEMGKVIGREKTEIDLESASLEEMVPYCRNDVKICGEFFLSYLAFTREHDVGNFGMTMAAQSLKAYRHRFMPPDILIHTEEDVIAFERKAYMGGRCEPFFAGDPKRPPYMVLDFNSMYPAVMREKPVPIRLIDYEENPSLETVVNGIKGYGAVAEVEIETDEAAYAKRWHKKIVFPVGTFDTFLCTEGLRYAARHGHLKQVYRIAWYDMKIIFREYVDYWYQLKLRYRKEGNKVYESFVKGMLNSLYGKFAQQRPIVKTMEPDPMRPFFTNQVCDTVDGKIYAYTQFLNHAEMTIGYENVRTSFTAISAHITEYARFRLWEAIKRAGRENCYYCDTDSLIISEDSYRRLAPLVDPHQLGKLKIEDRADRLVIKGAKHYTFGDTVKCKGIPKRAKEIAPDTWSFVQFNRLATHLEEEIESFYRLSYVTRTSKPYFDKGRVTPSGRVEPYTFSPEKLFS